MSKRTYIQKMAQLHWLRVLSENKSYFEESWSMPILKKLKAVRFTKDGNIKVNQCGKLALSEFPSLVKKWEGREND